MSIRRKVCLSNVYPTGGEGDWRRCQLNKENRCQRRSNMYVAQVGVGVRLWVDWGALGRLGRVVAWWRWAGCGEHGRAGRWGVAAGVGRMLGRRWTDMGRAWGGHRVGMGCKGFMPRGGRLGRNENVWWRWIARSDIVALGNNIGPTNNCSKQHYCSKQYYCSKQ